MNRRLLTPRWLLLHLAFVMAVIATGWLAWWQWERAHDAGGSFQNLGYALQWPLFGAFTIFLWYRLMRMERERPDDETACEEDSSQPGAGRSPQPAESRMPDPTTTSSRRLVPPPASPVSAEEDPELAAYNEYLAELNAANEPGQGERGAG